MRSCKHQIREHYFEYSDDYGTEPAQVHSSDTEVQAETAHDMAYMLQPSYAGPGVPNAVIFTGQSREARQ